MESEEYQNAVQMIANVILTQTKTAKYSSGELDEHLRQYIADSLRQHSNRLVDMMGEELETPKSWKQVHTNLSHMDDYLTQSYRQRRLELTDNRENLQDDSLNGSHVHVRAIRTLSRVLTKDVRIEGTTLLDKLVQQEALSEAGRSSILALPTKHGKNAAFWKHCTRYTYARFERILLPALKESNDEVNANLAKDIEEEMANPTQRWQNFSLCTFCKIQSKINIRQLSDKLYELGVLSESVRDDLTSISLSNAEKWKTLLQKVKKSILFMTLKQRFPDIYTKLKITPYMDLICTCTDNYIYTEMSQDGDHMAIENLSDIARLSDISSEIPDGCQTMPVDSRYVQRKRRGRSIRDSICRFAFHDHINVKSLQHRQQIWRPWSEHRHRPSDNITSYQRVLSQFEPAHTIQLHHITTKLESWKKRALLNPEITLISIMFNTSQTWRKQLGC